MGGTAFGMWNATFLVRSHGLSLQHAGLLTGLIGGTCAGFGVMFAGWLVDRGGGIAAPTGACASRSQGTWSACCHWPYTFSGPWTS